VAPGDPYYMGDDGRRKVEITPQITVDVNQTGLEVFDEVGLFETVQKMHTALKHNNRFLLGGEVIEELDGHLDNLLERRSEVGARMERFFVTDERLHSERLYLRELRSRAEDAPMAEIITEFIMQENAYHAALSTGARMVYPSLVDFLR